MLHKITYPQIVAIFGCVIMSDFYFPHYIILHFPSKKNVVIIFGYYNNQVT